MFASLEHYLPFDPTALRKRVRGGTARRYQVQAA